MHFFNIYVLSFSNKKLHYNRAGQQFLLMHLLRGCNFLCRKENSISFADEWRELQLKDDAEAGKFLPEDCWMEVAEYFCLYLFTFEMSERRNRTTDSHLISQHINFSFNEEYRALEKVYSFHIINTEYRTLQQLQLQNS